MTSLALTLINIADFYTRLRIAGMQEESIKMLKLNVTQTAILNKIDPIKLLSECVISYEEHEAKSSLIEESKFTKGLFKIE